MGIPEKENPLDFELAGSQSRGFNEAEALQNRISRYSVAKGRSVLMVDHLSKKLQQVSELTGRERFSKMKVNLSECANWLQFHHYYTVGKVRLVRASFCKQHLICPMCAIRRGAKSLKAYTDKYRTIIDSEPTLKASMVTLTVKNGPDLMERYNHLKNGVRRLQERRRDYLKKGRGRTEFRKILGAVGSYEFTNKGNGWHPHVHVIALHKENDLIDQWALSREWREITGDSYIVDVTPFDESKEPAQNFLEVFKYALKFSDLSLEDNLQAAIDLKGRNMMFSFGVFRGVQVPESLTDEVLDDLPYIELFYKYQDKSGYNFIAGGHSKIFSDKEKREEERAITSVRR